ncbi:MAG TPA: xanthine dehydrogenase family protein subunit M [Labilithrix sp.]|jgi:xanthine dehydrogenase YagS FAD-binding subunit
MEPFDYKRAADEAKALELAQPKDALFLAGGTNVVDYVRLGVMKPKTVVDVLRLPLAAIEPTAEGVSIGAMARNSDVARHPAIREGWPALAEALESGASPQLRNMATVGGNLLQRTRCAYFRDVAWACNKRTPGAGCSAMDGWTRMHAILGTSDKCIAAHPSDMCVALAALDAVVHVRGPNGARQIPIADFHTLPGDHPEIESTLAHGELITHVVLPKTPFAKRSRYVKARDRAQFAFALASCAAALEIDGGAIKSARVALGGVGTKPWRSKEAEAALVGKQPGDAAWRAAGEAALRDAKTKKDNAFKVELGKRVVAKALALAGGAS